MRILYQFPLSHFCEKARWLLDHKELEYVAQNLIPGLHRAFTQLKTGQNHLPILKDQDTWVADSTRIALYLDDHYPEHRLLSQQQKLRDQAIEIDVQAVELGEYVRRWGLAHVIQTEESLDILIGEKGYLRRFEKYSKPLLKSLISKSYRLDNEHVLTAKQRMDDIIQVLNQTLIDNGGRYLVGEYLGLADISVCSMLAPILELQGTPWEKEQVDVLPEEFKAYRDTLAALPLGQYVKRIYQTERHARVDWRGV